MPSVTKVPPPFGLSGGAAWMTLIAGPGSGSLSGAGMPGMVAGPSVVGAGLAGGAGVAPIESPGSCANADP
jgi:hypothetical protein